MITLAALPDGGMSDGAEPEVDFPGAVYHRTSPAERETLLGAIRSWLKRGAGAELVQVGRLLNPEHPAAAAAAAAAAASGTGACSFGLFAREGLPAGTVLCEYQGARYTSAAGVDPFERGYMRRASGIFIQNR